MPEKTDTSSDSSDSRVEEKEENEEGVSKDDNNIEVLMETDNNWNEFAAAIKNDSNDEEKIRKLGAMQDLQKKSGSSQKGKRQKKNHQNDGPYRTMTALNAASMIYQMDPITTDIMTEIETLQLLYRVAAPQNFSNLKLYMQQIIEIKNNLESFAHNCSMLKPMVDRIMLLFKIIIVRSILRVLKW